MSDTRPHYHAWDRAFAALLLLALLVYGYRTVDLPFDLHRLFKWKRLLAFAVAVLALRHIYYPSPWIGAEVWKALRRHLWDRGGSFALQVGLASRIAVLAVALAVAIAGPEKRGVPRAADDPFWNSVSRWDALRYLDIAADGYRWDPTAPEVQWNVAFFPGFAIAQRLAGVVVTLPIYVVGDDTWLGGSALTRLQVGGLLLSIGAFLWALGVVYRLARADIGEDRAKWAVLLVAYFPFALFYSVPYSEGLFFLAVTSAFLAAREDRPLAMFTWGAIAGLTRQTGVMLALPMALLAVEPVWRYWRGRAEQSQASARLILAATGPAVGLAIHMTYLWATFGDPWAWVEAQKAWWHSESTFPFFVERFRAVQEYGLWEYFRRQPGPAIGTLVPIFAVAMLWRAWKLSPAYAALIVVILAPAIGIDTPSIGRLASPVFPLFIALASMLPSTRHNWILVLLLGGGQLWACSLFFRWESMS